MPENTFKTEKIPARGAHPFNFMEKQETATVTADKHRCGSVRHTRRRCPLLYLHQYALLRDAGLCREPERTDCAGPPQSLQTTGTVRYEKKHKSFVGMLPIPLLHGCTLGEMAGMINEKAG